MKDSGRPRESCTYECVNFQKKQHRLAFTFCWFAPSVHQVSLLNTHTHTHTHMHTHTHTHGLPLSGCLFYSNCTLYTPFLHLWNSLWFAFKPPKEAAKDWVLACECVCVCVCVCVYVWCVFLCTWWANRNVATVWADLWLTCCFIRSISLSVALLV